MTTDAMPVEPLSKLVRKRRGRLSLNGVWRSLYRDWTIITILLVVVGYVHARHMSVTPALVTTDDEGTYVAQAWAIITHGELAHYTYWYDHPPLGWIQLAGWAWLTDGFNRYHSAVALGREFMLVVKLAAVVMMYLLARRLGMNKFFAAASVCLFGLSPLAVYFQRLTFLDNITLPWLLAAFYFAASPRNRLSAHAGSAACFAVAILTKETILVILPALLWQLRQGSHPHTRRMSFVIWSCVFGVMTLFYPLTAVIKKELLPGRGHVDLWYAIKWQLFDRASSGSIFDPRSAAHIIVHGWASIDPWLVGLAVVMFLPATLCRELRPIALAFGIQLAVMVRPGGYLPQPYVICMIPFAALIVAGTVSGLWDSGTLNRFLALRRQIPWLSRYWGLGLSYAQAAVKFPAIALTLGFAIFVGASEWRPGLYSLMHDNRNVSVVETMRWMQNNVPIHKGDTNQPVRVIVSDAMWVDLERMGYSPEWYFKVDLDPAVKKTFPHGWQDADYVIFTNEMNEIAKSSSSHDMQTTIAARNHGRLVAKYGTLSETIWIYQVIHPS
jgi:hypothetical protein